MAYGRLDSILRNRNKWPLWINKIIDSIAENPMGLFGTIASWRYIPRGVVPDTSAVQKSTFRVGIGPVNYSNQSTLWASALRKNFSDVSTATFAVDVPGGFDFPSDLIIPIDFYQRSREWQSSQAQALTKFTHLLVEAEEPLLGRFLGRSLTNEKKFFEAHQVSLAYIAHGTDVRDPEKHIQRTKWSPFRDSSYYLPRMSKIAQQNVKFLTSISNPVFVSTPDLLLDIPSAQWCPVVVDQDIWRPASAKTSPSEPLRVAHVPSVKSMKGTDLIEPILHNLHDQKVITYTPITNVPSEKMPEVISHADVVLDQFRLGSYGVAACEAMSSGKTVVGHVLPEVREVVFQQTKLELPIVEATPDTLMDVILSLSENRQLLKQKSHEGVSFISKVHNGTLSSKTLMDYWISPGSSSNRAEVNR